MLNFVFLKTKKKHKKLEFALFNTSYDDTQGGGKIIFGCFR